MTITKSSVVGALISLSLVAACGRDDKTNNDMPDAGNGSGTDGGTTGKGMTVKDVQADSLPSGTAVELDGVVVTAIDSFGVATGDFWVQDLDGGARSGVHVYGASATDVAKLAVGDLVNIKGAQKFEYAPGTTKNPTSTQSLTEVEGVAKGTMVVTKAGTGAVPAPHPLDAVAIAAMSATDRATFLEDWEGVPVILSNARPSNPGSFGSGAEDQKSFDVTNVVTVESNMAAFPASSANNTTCYASITGVVDFVVGKYTLLPTSTSGFVENGTSCAAATVYTPTTIAHIQDGTNTNGVKLTGVYVVAAGLASDGTATKTIWVADDLVAAPNTGIEVYMASSGVDDNTRKIGAKVDIQGTITEFNNVLTEFALGTAAVTLNTAAGATAPTPITGIGVDVLGALDTGKQYEGSLVTITKMTVTATSGATNQFTLTDSTGTKTIVMDDDVFGGFTGALPVVGDCYKSITGVMDAQKTFRTINPRTAADLEKGASAADCK